MNTPADPHSILSQLSQMAASARGIASILTQRESLLLAWWNGRKRFFRYGLLILGLILYLAGLFLDRYNGFVREMWSGSEPAGEPVVTCIDRAIDFNDYRLRADLYSARQIHVRWTGYAPGSSNKIRLLYTEHDGHLRIRHGDIVVIDEDADNPNRIGITEEVFSDGTEPLVIDYTGSWGASRVLVKWEDRGVFRVMGGPGIFRSPEAMKWRLFVPWVKSIGVMGGILFLLILVLTIADWRLSGVEDCLKTRWNRGIALLILVGVAVGLRLWLLYRAGFMTLADEAIVGVMGKHILEGKGLPCLFYGQFYGGPLESYLAVPLFAVFGTSPVILKLVPMLLGTAIIFPVYAIARRLVSNTGAMLCASYIAFPPLMCALYSLMVMIGPVEIPLLGMIYAALMLKRLDNPINLPWDEFLMGLVAGLGFWVNAQILYFLIPCEILLLLSGRPLLLRFWWPCPGTIGLFIGMFPLLYYSYFTGWAPFKFLLEGGQRYSTPFAVFQNSLLGQCLPELLGGRPRWVTGHDIYFPTLARLVFWSFLAASLVVIIRPFFLREKRWPAWFLSLIVLIIPIIFCASSFGERAFSRYLFAAFPLFPLIWVTALTFLGKHLKIPVVIIGLSLIAIHARGLLGENPFLFFQHEENIVAGRLLPENNDRLISDLKQRGIDAINTDFWIGWNVAFSSGESIVHDDWLDRYPPYRDRFLASTRPAYVYHNNEQRGEWQIDGLDELFSLLDYECFDSPPYRVYVPKTPVIPRKQWTSFASENEGASGLAIDGDINLFSTWRSAGSQVKGAFLLVDTQEARASQRFVVHWGPAIADVPQGAQLLVSSDGETWGLPLPLQSCKHLNGAYADLGGAAVRMFKIEITEDVPNRAWSVYDVFLN